MSERNSRPASAHNAPPTRSTAAPAALRRPARLEPDQRPNLFRRQHRKIDSRICRLSRNDAPVISPPAGHQLVLAGDRVADGEVEPGRGIANRVESRLTVPLPVADLLHDLADRLLLRRVERQRDGHAGQRPLEVRGIEAVRGRGDTAAPTAARPGAAAPAEDQVPAAGRSGRPTVHLARRADPRPFPASRNRPKHDRL